MLTAATWLPRSHLHANIGSNGEYETVGAGITNVFAAGVYALATKIALTVTALVFSCTG
jgi:hypothetical protein